MRVEIRTCLHHSSRDTRHRASSPRLDSIRRRQDSLRRRRGNTRLPTLIPRRRTVGIR